MRLPILRRKERALRELQRELAVLRVRLGALEARVALRRRSEIRGAARAAREDPHEALARAVARPGGADPVDPGETVEIETGDGLLLAPAWDRVITPILQAGRPWEPAEAAFLDSHLAPGATFLDVGAHVGCHAVRAARRCGESGWVVALSLIHI